MNTFANLSAGFCFICWGVAGLSVAWAVWKSKSGENGSGGRDPGDDDPYHFDPTDPGDWWKKAKN